MKTKKIITIALSVIAALLVAFSGVLKLAGADEVVKGMTQLGVGEYLPYLGGMEILFAILFLYPKTMKLGFILLTCYFAGAMGTELSHQGPIQNPMILLAIIWVAAFLQNPYLFLADKEVK